MEYEQKVRVQIASVKRWVIEEIITSGHTRLRVYLVLLSRTKVPKIGDIVTTRIFLRPDSGGGFHHLSSSTTASRRPWPEGGDPPTSHWDPSSGVYAWREVRRAVAWRGVLPPWPQASIGQSDWLIGQPRRAMVHIEPGCTRSGLRRVEYRVEIVREMVVDGEVNRARSMLQNADLVAAKTNGPDVYVLNCNSDQEGGCFDPDLRLKGNTQEGYGLSWSPLKQGYLLSHYNNKGY
ncbi:hypothetical protein Sjap_009017 [Stephania japonica]|uniref:Uncharacterized protein n=1 Tax=Stephania japonica TaxID=461633 RepID=A0AAP0JS61_9MAGN